jgi:hypothetical protein
MLSVNDFPAPAPIAELGDKKLDFRITYPPTGQQRMERIVTRGGKGFRGKFKSAKSQRMHHWAHPRVSAVMRLLEASPGVAEFKESPCRIEVASSAAVWRHYPDLLVRFRDRVEIWDIRSQADRTDADFPSQVHLAQRAANHHAMQYRVVDAEALGRVRFNNALKLFRLGHRLLSTTRREALRQVLSGRERICLDDFGGSGPLPDFYLGGFCRLILEGHYVADFNRPIDRRTPFSRGDYTKTTWFLTNDFVDFRKEN